MTFSFQAKQESRSKLDIPYIEDATKDTAQFYSSTKTVEQAQADLSAAMRLLGGIVTNFLEGEFVIEKKKRFGYKVLFQYLGVNGEINLAGLPIRTYTEKKEKQVKVQALLNAAAWLRATHMMSLFNPENHVLIQYLTMPNGMSLGKYLVEYGNLPMLVSGKKEDVVDGEVYE